MQFKNKINVFNLITSKKPLITRECEVCIVGAGAVGIYLASELASKGVSTILLDAGGMECIKSSDIDFDVSFEDELYSGATEGRYFGLGGTTSHWGGVLTPHTQYDLRKENADTFDVWQHVVDVVSITSESVLKKLGWNGCADFNIKDRQLTKIQKVTKISFMLDLILPFRKKNLVRLLKRLSKNNSNLTIFINSVVCEWESLPGNHEENIQTIKAKSKNHNSVEIKADKFIISAGAIESARILLELNQSSERSILKPTAAVGCYLTDHISLPVADVSKISVPRVIRYFSPFFSKGWMRSFRFIDYTSDHQIQRSFFHFIFKHDNAGFSLAKELLTSLQAGKWPKVTLIELLHGALGVLQLAIYRYLYSVLYIPKNTKIHLQLDVEQHPNKDNCITLGNELDEYGRQSVKINWHISEQDIDGAKSISNKMLKKWSLYKKIKLDVLTENQYSTKPYDAYHPVGTCRMGECKESVVDKNLKVWGVENLWVASTGVLPSAGTANPTFTILCLAERLLGQIINMKRFKIER
jgi:choline dehydrogenase-like flavoprotein